MKIIKNEEKAWRKENIRGKYLAEGGVIEDSFFSFLFAF